MEVLRLRPVRRVRFFVVGLAFHEVGRAGVPVDVMVAGDDDDAFPRETEDLGQASEESEDIVELLFLSPFGEVAGGNHEVRDKNVPVFQISQVIAKARKQGIEGGVGLRQPEPAEAVVAAELGVGDVQEGDAARGLHGRSVLRSGMY
jgi:hypothetical protein